MKLGKAQMKILVLAPHTDDGEFGCGGTIHKLIREGNEVFQVAFSTAAQIGEHGTSNEILVNEIKQASKTVGIKEDNLFIHDFQVREFWQNRQRILDLLLYYKKKLNPDVIFVPCGNDIHQDHNAIYTEALRAFKHQTILGYELPWNLYKFDYQLFSHLDKEDIQAKTQAVACYVSQKHRIYASDDWVHSLARTRGVQANTLFAETFEVIRINIK